ncbi:lymphocyte-specific helicase [Saccoglossus kowalevskii]|uniref:Lymphoid-specific helicase n=1 Tax=Saccoglossus kowalevskii TaxID=10224 RepID=A0ABM0LVM3_SACKO|nr:PREDICTED: lymphoid-specific helicase [Saccoglossus kowalevskii]
MSEDRKSPTMAVEEAAVPEEAAHENENISKKWQGSIMKDDDASLDSEISIPTDGLLTPAMVQEEKLLHRQTVKETKQLEKQAEDEWEANMQQQRYKRLQHLLETSNIYTNFLLSKMEAQQKREEEKRARQEKRMKKKLMKQKQDEVVKTGETKEATKTKSVDTKTQTEVTSQTVEEGTKRGRKRKAKDETYSIASVLKKEDLENKRRKLGTDSTDGPQCEPVVSENIQSEVVKADEIEKDTFSRTINGEKVSDKQPEMFTGGVLRDYQIAGMEWLKVLFENGVNGILADEMGLGKTVQCIALFAHLVNMGVTGPFLVCAPLSTLPNWVSEFQRFTPKVPIVLYHGSITERESLRRSIRRKHGNKQSHPVVITSYEIVMRDRKYLQGHEWKYIIVDEGHRIKNLNCVLIRELKQYKSANRILLTGTPLQNNLSELWSMLNFLLPDVFNDLASFESWFDLQSLSEKGGDEALVAREQEKNILSMLHQILSPFLLRRLKTDVALSIPPKKEVLVYAPLTPLQHEYYEATVDKTILKKVEDKKETPVIQKLCESGRPKRRCSQKINYETVFEEEKPNDDVETWFEKFVKKEDVVHEKIRQQTSEVNIKLQNIMMLLRKCCNHPYLLSYPINERNEYIIDEQLVQKSGKCLILDRLLPALKERGHKVLLFSQMTKMLDILGDYCFLRKFKTCRLDGTMSYVDRQEQISTFNNDKDAFIFLLSTRAGGLGLNLASADTVIIYDSDWNPQSDLQAQDRCHRIGQNKPVTVFRLVTQNTIDQKIVERASAKRKLEKMVIHQGKFKGGIDNLEKDAKSVLDAEELLKLLRSQNHDRILKSKIDNILSDEELEKLLDRSYTHHSNVDGEATTESCVFKVVDGSDEEKPDIKVLA